MRCNIMNVGMECWKITVLVTVPFIIFLLSFVDNFAVRDFTTTIFCIEIYDVVDTRLWNIEKRFTSIV